MPFVEKKFATKWYEYALRKDTDRSPFRVPALEAISNGGNYCLCSLTQGLATQNDDLLNVNESILMTLIYGDIDFTHKQTDFESIKKYNRKTDIIKFEQCAHFPDLEYPDKFESILRKKLT